MTLGLGIITRNVEHGLLDTALASVFGKVDNIYITVADKSEPTAEIKAIADKYKAHLSFFEWVNDFAAARNFNMSQCKDDWYTWMDTDDTVNGMEHARGLLAQQNTNIGFAICTYNYDFYPSGMVRTKHPKERFFRMDGTFKWKGKLHENCISEHQVDGTFLKEIEWDHHTTGERSLESSRRNVSIIEQEIEEQAEKGDIDPRTAFNLGMAYASIAQRTMAETDWVRSIRAFAEYLKIGGWSEHAYMAWKFIGYGQQCVGRQDLALNSYFEALKLQPAYADAYASIGSVYDHLNEYEKAEVWYRLALTDGRENGYAEDSGLSTITPLVALARILALKGKIDEAERFAKAAKDIMGTDPQVDAILDEIGKIRERIEEGKNLVKKMEPMAREDAMAFFSSLSEVEKTLPDVVQFRRKQKWKEQSSGRDLVIMTGQSYEEWNPDSAKTGIGGSEEAVINMAKRLKSDGWNVTVYGSHGPEPKEYDGVWYRPWWDFGLEEPCDIFIAWRDATIFEYKINAKKTYLWLHDTVPQTALTDKRLRNIYKVITLSEWHRRLYPNVPDEKMFISRNGIVPEHFKEVLPKKKHKVLYTSAPDRGLDTLLKLWPKVKERVPDAELYWAYGWTTYDKIHHSNPRMQRYKQEICELLKQPGVHELGRIGHEELAKHMLEASAWAYPTTFTEISCITAMKMQAAGCVPVTTTVAALDETVQFGYKLPYQDIATNDQAKHEFVESLVSVLEDGYARTGEMREWALKFYDWDTVAKEWSNEFLMSDK